MKHFDDDMDELFNKAGRDYPLKTEPSNWDAVRGALNAAEDVPAVQKKSGWRRYLPLLLLLLIPLSVYLFVDRGVPAARINEEKEIAKVSNNEEKMSSDMTKPFAEKKETVSYDRTKKFTSDSKATSISEKTYSTSDTKKYSSSERKTYPISEAKTSSTSKRKIKSTFNRKTNLSTPEQETFSYLKKKSAREDSFSSEEENLFQWKKIPPYGAFAKQNVSVKEPITAPGGAPVPNAKQKKHSPKAGFYYGVSAAPDISMIKAQRVKGTGYSAGIVVGYQLNGHWSIETGMLWSRKKYFTSGEYFDKKSAGIPWSVEVLWLNGGCNMFEFPLLARYDFSLKKNTFFATAGLTSYMMKKEDYKYGAEVGVTPNYYEGERAYDRSGDHLFSNLQLSAGYKFNVSPKMNIRIEPYLKAPLKKIGIGKMPITSAGLSFGITRDFR